MNDTDFKKATEFTDLDLDRNFLMWVHERLQLVYGENELLDYMHRLRAIIERTPYWNSNRCTSFACNGLDELKKALIKQAEDQREDDRPLTQKELHDMGLRSCEQCGETAWDGRICHACGMKEI